MSSEAKSIEFVDRNQTGVIVMAYLSFIIRQILLYERWLQSRPVELHFGIKSGVPAESVSSKA